MSTEVKNKILNQKLSEAPLDLVAVELEDYRRTPVIGRSLKLTRMVSYQSTINNGHLTRFLHLKGIRKAGYGYSNYQRVASHITLDDTSKLLPGMKSYLKKAYKDKNKHSYLIGNNDLAA